MKGRTDRSIPSFIEDQVIIVDELVGAFIELDLSVLFRHLFVKLIVLDKFVRMQLTFPS